MSKMEVDDESSKPGTSNSDSETASNEDSVMACGSTTGSVTISLHPLVIMNISEHWTRTRAQEGKPTQGEPKTSEPRPHTTQTRLVLHVI